MRIEAVDYNGDSMGSADLGNVYHTAFALKDKLPRLRRHSVGNSESSGKLRPWDLSSATESWLNSACPTTFPQVQIRT